MQAKTGICTVRLNVLPDTKRRVPKLDVELFYWFGNINMYVNLLPRANLVRRPGFYLRLPFAGYLYRVWHQKCINW